MWSIYNEYEQSPSQITHYMLMTGTAEKEQAPAFCL